jgi:hypothetical protein
MAKLPSLQQIRESIRSKVMLDNLAKQSNGDEKPLFNAMAIVPENDMWLKIQWLHEFILPKVELQHGSDSKQYKNFVGVRDAVIWAMYILSAYERQALQIGNDKMLLEMYREKANSLERELLKYRTAEQMLSDDSMKDYREVVLKRAISMLEQPGGAVKPLAAVG